MYVRTDNDLRGIENVFEEVNERYESKRGGYIRGKARLGKLKSDGLLNTKEVFVALT